MLLNKYLDVQRREALVALLQETETRLKFWHNSYILRVHVGMAIAFFGLIMRARRGVTGTTLAVISASVFLYLNSFDVYLAFKCEKLRKKLNI